MSTSTSSCPQCGAPLAVPGARCPLCALDAALGPSPVDTPIGVAADWSDLLSPSAELPTKGPASEKATRRFGRYELLEDIGRGGMGAVYRARQENPTRVVALKVLLPQQASAPGMIKRFRAEAAAISSLDHPHILPMYEAGERDGLPFFSMKFAEGGALSGRVRSFAGRSREAARLVAEIAWAVHHAHQRGILHRDLKPANILLDRDGTSFVADFGIAKWLGTENTLTGLTMGTPAYMAPEQATGRSADLTVAADVYGLGAILYELLVQQPPFSADTAVDLLRRVIDVEPEPPRSIRPEIERDLETICLKCLAKNPAQRYRSAAALADDLERWLAGQPVMARPVGVAGRVWRWARRSPALAGLSAALLALGLAAAIGSVLGVRRIAAERNDALAAKQAATDQLRAALLAQARTAQLSGRVGQRFDALEALKKAAAIRPGRDLREEALTAFALPDARRGNEWHIRYASNSPAAFDSTLEHCVVESESGIITLRRTADGAEQRRFKAPAGHPRALYIAPLSADDTRFAVRFADDRVSVYELAREVPLLELMGRPVCQMNESFAYDFCFTPDGTELAVGLPEGGISLHDLATGRETARIECGFVPAVIAFSPEGGQVALAALRKREIHIYDRAKSLPVRRLLVPSSVMHCAWRPDGAELAAACFDNRIYVWESSSVSDMPAAVLRGHVAVPALLAWSADGRWLASSARDVTVRIWDVGEGTCALLLPLVAGEPCLRFSRDGRLLAHGSDGTFLGRLALSIGDLRRELLRTPPGDSFNVRGCLDVSADGRLFVTAARSGVRLLNAHTGAQLALLPPPFGVDHTAHFTPASDALIYSVENTGTWRRSLRWTEDTELEIGPPERVDARAGLFVTDVRGSPPRVALVGDTPPLASILSLGVASSRQDFPLHGEPSACSLSPDGKFLATADREGEEADASDVHVWDLANGKLLRRLDLGRNGSARFSPDGTWLWASGGEKSTLLRWPGLERGTAAPVSGFDGWFSPDQSLVAIAEDERMALLRVADGEILGHLPGAQIIAAAFSADGLSLLQYVNYRVYAWDLRAVRQELGALGLDWDSPPLPFPAGQLMGAVPVRVTVRE